jgi:hypothetical protein
MKTEMIKGMCEFCGFGKSRGCCAWLNQIEEKSGRRAQERQEGRQTEEAEIAGYN